MEECKYVVKENKTSIMKFINDKIKIFSDKSDYSDDSDDEKTDTEQMLNVIKVILLTTSKHDKSSSIFEKV